MKAIETVYKGYRFRSRLEARWAVFFDALGWKWEYEKEGYELPSGKYLPDFYFPEIKAFGEVKPESLTALEMEKCADLKRTLKCDVFLLVGVPDLTTYENIMWYSDGANDDIVFVAKGCKYYPYHFSSSHYKECPKGDWEYFSETVVAAKAARSARFEFGESGGM